MLETIATTSRAIGSEAKLLILHPLASEPELSAADIAKRARMTQDLASHHLRDLRALGLLSLRRSGAHVYYRLGSDTPTGGAFSPIKLIRRAFRDVRWATRGWDEDTVVHLSSRAAAMLAANVVRVLDVIFDSATAFSNVRRLQILRLLSQNGACTTPLLVKDLSMSLPACLRHLHKLRRRGYARRDRGRSWALCSGAKTRFHAALLGQVLSDLA